MLYKICEIEIEIGSLIGNYLTTFVHQADKIQDLQISKR